MDENAEIAFSMEEIESFPNDENDENCLLILKLFIKLIECNNPPVLFRSQEFLQNIDVYYIPRLSNFFKVINVQHGF
jgi:hypothetical protein